MTRYRMMLAALGALVVAAVVTVAVLQPGAPATGAGGGASAGLVPVDQRAAAPEFTGIGGWLNSPPLTVAGERGHVVLIDFWTFSCVNCVRTLPHIRGLADGFRSQGLVVVGVHSPEFDFERDPANVAGAVRHLDVTWPVALDPQMATWNAWNNQYWPAQYLIDRDGKVAFAHFGEGDDAAIDAAVASLIGVQGTAAAASSTVPGSDISPELYAGSSTAAEHRSHLGDGEEYGPPGSPTLYPAAAAPAAERDAIELSGSFSDGGDHVTATGPGHVRLRFHASDVFVVAGRTGPPVVISATLDGGPVPAPEVGPALAGSGRGAVNATDLYQLLHAVTPGDHVLDLAVPAGFSLFTFTFG